MTGSLDMGDQKITGLAEGTDDSDGVNAGLFKTLSSRAL